MRISWEVKSVNKCTVSEGRIGRIRITRRIEKDGNASYCLATMINGKRKIILDVPHNPVGVGQIDAQKRSVWLATCMDNCLSFDFLEIEKGENVKYNPHYLEHIVKEKLKPKTATQVVLSRIYKYDGKRGVHYYRPCMIMNTNTNWPEMVGYRDIFTGDNFGRLVTEFTPAKYTLLEIGHHITADPNSFVYTKQG